ncbi:MAG: hypothetical protein HYY64_11655 [Candidatus Rokubacteria bacterium]|nr:hypothetical protein [Candidatus Rokubacteria bacterium]
MRIRALFMSLALLLLATPAFAGLATREAVQAPRGQEEIQAPRGQDVQAPRGEGVQAPRSARAI